MKNTIIIIVILIVLAIGAYFIFYNNNSYQTPANTTQTEVPATSPLPTPPVATTTQTAPVTPAVNTPATTVPKTPAPANASVSIKNFAFSPSTVTVKVGTKITWTNNDSVAHTVTSDSGTTLNSTVLSPGQSYSVTLTNTGSINYHCTIHPMMRGVVIVTN
jgi:plastocyanin